MQSNEVHLIIGTVHYHTHGHDRKGVCSVFDVIEKEGAMTREAAEAYLNDMQKKGCYQRDVY